MSVGFPVDKNTVDQRLASLAWQLRNTFNEIATVKAWLDTQTDAQLVAIGYSGSATAGEVQIARTAYTDLNNLGKIAHAQATQATANDFFFWANKLLGVQ
jgi:phosphoenolpyruvate carboxylase